MEMIKLGSDRFPVVSDVTRWIIAFALMTALTTIIGVFFTAGIEAFRISAGISVLFFVPGLSLSYLIVRPGEMGWLFRWALAPILSLATEPVTLFFASRFGLPIKLWSAVLVALFIAIVSLVLAEWMMARRRTARG